MEFMCKLIHLSISFILYKVKIKFISYMEYIEPKKIAWEFRPIDLG